MTLNRAFADKLARRLERRGADGTAAPQPADAPRPCVLVVDDEPDITRSVAALLGDEYDVLTANSADEGVRLLHSRTVAVVLTDQRMPGGTGAQLLAQCVDISPETTRVLFTGYSDISAVIDAVNDGQVYRYITKPWQPDDLRATLRQGVERHQLVLDNRRLVTELTQANDLLERRVRDRTRQLGEQNRALRASERRYRSLFENMPLGLAHCRMEWADGRPADWTYLVVNDAFTTITGLAGAVGQRVTTLIPEIAGSNQELFEIYGRVARGGPAEAFETWLPALGRWLQVGVYSPEPGEFVAVFADITERKTASERIEASEERHRSIIETALDGFWLVDMEGRLLEVNEAYAAMSGYCVPELLALHVSDLEASEPALLARDRLARPAGDGQDRFESVHRRKDGTVFDVEVGVQHRPAEGGQIVAFLRDISLRKAQEQERASLEAQLRQAQKMESVGRLAGGVAHDFNNMLTAILGNTEFALSNVGASDPLREDLLEIKNAAQRSADLTRQLLAFARKTTVVPAVLDLNNALRHLKPLLERLLGEGISIVWELDQSLWPITIDPSQLDQAVTNLCLNSRDAIADVGSITITTANRGLSEHDCVGIPEAVPGDYVLLRVRDTGHGMEPDVLANVFEPFFTTKPLGTGTGLGLATVWGAVRQAHGFVTVASEPGQGAALSLYFPRLVADAAPIAGSSTPAATGGGHETILIVEDEPALLRLAARALRGLGYTVLATGGPAEAMRMAREYPADIDLLLTDVVMPGMNGRDLAEAIAPLRPSTRAMFMSGYSADVFAGGDPHAAGVAFMQKPFAIPDLAVKVRHVLDDALGGSSAGTPHREGRAHD